MPLQQSQPFTVSGGREVLEPIGREDHACEMATRGVTGDEDAVRIAAKARGVAMYPGDGVAHLQLHVGEVGAAAGRVVVIVVVMVAVVTIVMALAHGASDAGAGIVPR